MMGDRRWSLTNPGSVFRQHGLNSIANPKSEIRNP